MNQIAEGHISQSVSKVQDIYTSASGRIEALQKGQRLPVTMLSEQLATEFNMNKLAIYNILTPFVQGYPGVVQKAGRNGGIEKL